MKTSGMVPTSLAVLAYERVCLLPACSATALHSVCDSLARAHSVSVES